MVGVREFRPDDLKKKSMLQWYDQMLRLKPNDTGLLYARGAALVKVGEHEEALESFRKITTLDPQHLKGWEALAKTLFESGRHGEALLCYNRLVELDSRDETFWYGKGETLFKLERYKEALDCYTFAIEINQNYTDAWVGKGNALKAMKSPRKPKPKKRKKTEDKYSKVAGKVESLEDAMKCFLEALRRDPKHAKALEGKGMVLCEMGEYEEGLHNLDKALKADPKSVETLYSKGKVLTKIGKAKEAKKTFSQIMDAPFSYNVPHDPDNWIAKGKASYELERFSDALLYHERALAINPEDPRAWYGKGDALSKLGRYTEAIKCYEKAIQAKPKSEPAWFGKATALRYAGKTDESLSTYDKVIEINSKNTHAWYDKGTLFYILKRFSEALECFTQVLKINPHHKNARKKKKETEAKIKDEKKQKERIPTDPKEALMLKARKAYKHSKYKLALEFYDKVLKLDDKNIEAWNEKANTLSKLGRYTESMFCIETAVKLKHQGILPDKAKQELVGEEKIVEGAEALSAPSSTKITPPYPIKEVEKKSTIDTDELKNMLTTLKSIPSVGIESAGDLKITGNDEPEKVLSTVKSEPLPEVKGVVEEKKSIGQDLKTTISAIKDVLLFNPKLSREEIKTVVESLGTEPAKPIKKPMPKVKEVTKKMPVFKPETMNDLDVTDKKIVLAFAKGIKSVPQISKELGIQIVVGYSKVLRLEDMGVIECVGKIQTGDSSREIKLYKCSDKVFFRIKNKSKKTGKRWWFRFRKD